MSVKCEVVLWIENFFRHHSGVCHIIYGIRVIIEELCPSHLLLLCVVPFGTYLDDAEGVGIYVELASCLCYQN